MTTGEPHPTFRSVHARLFSAQKPQRGQAYSVLVNRRLGRIAACAAFLAGMTPNQVTAVSAVFSGAGIALLATGPVGWVTAVGVSGLLVVGYALDSADGQLARLRGGGSLSGEWLDHMIDSAKIVAVHLAIAIYLFRADDIGGAPLLIPLAYAVVAVVTFFAIVMRDQMLRQHESVVEPSSEPFSVTSLLVRLPHDYGFLCLVFVLLQWPTAFLAVYAFCLAYNTLYMAAALTKWFREVQAIDESSVGPA